MSFSNILSAVLLGMEVRLVRVEADISNGLPMFHMVGYLSAEVKEISAKGEHLSIFLLHWLF